MNCGFRLDYSSPKERPIERPVITALAHLLRHHVDLSKSRLETMALLAVGMIGARTVNLVYVADERGSGSVDPASIWRHLQRFFQHGPSLHRIPKPQRPAALPGAPAALPATPTTYTSP
jgi:hypothetical protein